MAIFSRKRCLFRVATLEPEMLALVSRSALRHRLHLAHACSGFSDTLIHGRGFGTDVELNLWSNVNHGSKDTYLFQTENFQQTGLLCSMIDDAQGGKRSTSMEKPRVTNWWVLRPRFQS